MARHSYDVPGDASGPAKPVFLVDANGEMVRSAHPLAVQLVNAELDVEIGEVVTVKGGAAQTDDVKVTLDGEQVTVVPPTAAAVVTPVDAATVAASAWSALDGQATGGHGWAAVLVICDKNHTVRGVAGLEDFSDYTKGGSIPSDYTGKTDNTAKGGEWYVFDVSGRTHFCPTVQNTDATDATVTCKVVFFD